MSSETTSSESVSVDPVDVSISLHGIVCDVMSGSVLREEFRTEGKSGPAWSQAVQSAHNSIEHRIESADIPESVCDCDAFEVGELTCFACYKHGIQVKVEEL